MSAVAAHAAKDETDIRERIRGTNVNPRTLLATDYLNHFNEVLMLIELVPDDPERLRHVATTAATTLRSLADEMNGIIHGTDATLDQSAIDQVLDQDAIDKMF